MMKQPQRLSVKNNINMIFHIGKTSIYIATRLKFLNFSWFPRYSYFDGGSYYKLSFYWLYSLIELSGPKNNTCVYKKISLERMNEILKNE
jgi:hypothetical protein